MNLYEQAMKKLNSKGIELKNHGYRAYAYDCNRKIHIGSYDTLEQAEQELYNYRIQRFENEVYKYEMNMDDGVVIFDEYVIFPSGNIFNLNGVKLKYCTDGSRAGAVDIHGKTYVVNTLLKQVFGMGMVNLRVKNTPFYREETY